MNAAVLDTAAAQTHGNFCVILLRPAHALLDDIPSAHEDIMVEGIQRRGEGHFAKIGQRTELMSQAYHGESKAAANYGNRIAPSSPPRRLVGGAPER